MQAKETMKQFMLQSFIQAEALEAIRDDHTISQIRSEITSRGSSSQPAFRRFTTAHINQGEIFSIVTRVWFEKQSTDKDLWIAYDKEGNYLPSMNAPNTGGKNK